MIATRPFYTAAVLFAAAGAALRLAPVSIPEPGDPALALPVARVLPPQQSQVTQERYAAIVGSNAFSAGRRAPKTRFVPEGLRRDTQPAPRRARKPAEIPVRLFGITRGPGGAVALIDADTTVPGAEVYHVGDAVRGGRLTAIGDSTVTLSRPSGPLMLRLPDAGERR